MTYYREFKNHHQKALAQLQESGFVESVDPPIARVKGLPGVRFNEIVYFESGEMGTVISLDPLFCEVLVFSRDPISAGCEVSRSGRTLELGVSTEYLGKSIDPLGRIQKSLLTKDGQTTEYIPAYEKILPVEKPVPGINSREKITVPFETGVTVVDLMVPLGCGQRQLVLGDRQTGKTEFFLQTMLTQASKGTVCIYANIGKKASNIRHIEHFVADQNIGENVIVMSSGSTDPLGMIHITPYCAMTLAEYFVEKGRNVMLILDDMSTHARFYREISLILRRFPGRNSYPGDIFYSHSRLLERAGNFRTNDAVNSLTCLIAAETIQSDISGYIQTNLMSITDGHIYFDHELFAEGRRPAINYFLSVTRVGRQTQTKIKWGISRELSTFLSLYEKTQRFIHFGAELNEGIKSTMDMGAKLIMFFDQSMGTIIDQNLQIIIYCLIWTGAITFEGIKNIKFLGDRSSKLYRQDPVFRQIVDQLLTESTDINTLLGRVSMKSKDILKYLDLEKRV